MAEQEPLKIPKKLPLLDFVAEKFAELCKRPIYGLYQDLDLYSILGRSTDITRVWLTGSQAWHIAMYGELAPPGKDYDFIFADQGEALNVIGNFYRSLDNHELYYTLTENAFGGARLVNAISGATIIDAWDLTEASIAEEISGFKHPHERVAIALATQAREIQGITRLIKPREFGDRKTKRVQLEYPSYGS